MSQIISGSGGYGAKNGELAFSLHHILSNASPSGDTLIVIWEILLTRCGLIILRGNLRKWKVTLDLQISNPPNTSERLVYSPLRFQPDYPTQPYSHCLLTVHVFLHPGYKVPQARRQREMESRRKGMPWSLPPGALMRGREHSGHTLTSQHSTTVVLI